MNSIFSTWKRITSPVALHTFLNDIQRDPHGSAAIRELTIQLKDPFSYIVLRQCLTMMTPYITDLILLLPSDSPPDVLSTLHFKSLEYFQTNLPHRHLSLFIREHKKLVDLSLDACGVGHGEACPLRALDLRRYVSVECPTACAIGTAHPGLLRLTLQERGESIISAPAVLRSLASPLPALFSLTLDFFPDDYDILQRIVFVAPKLQKLKLLEKPRTYRRSVHARRAWNDITVWSRTLLKLVWLEELALRTASTFVSSPVSLEREGNILSRWASIRRARPSNRALEHPTMTSMRIWYRVSGPHNGVLTLWSKSSGAWRNIFRDVCPSRDALF